MKLDSAVIMTKGGCYLTIGFFTPLTVGLAQWANSGEWPGRLVWIIMGASCMVGGANSLLSFLSGSYTDYVKGRTNGNPPSSQTDFFGKPLVNPPPVAAQPKTP